MTVIVYVISVVLQTKLVKVSETSAQRSSGAAAAKF